MMKKWIWLVPACMGLVLAGCAGPSRNAVFQTSTIDALLAGVYDGDLPLSELRAHGDFGIGTYYNLDGEMVLVDGEFHQVRADGRVYRPDPDGETPFATVCRFTGGTPFAVTAGQDMEGVEQLVDAHAANPNLFYAIRIDGYFKSVKTRSVPAQSRPYPPLKDVAATQPVFNRKNVSGTVVGFRCPTYVKGINVPGYHLHFLSEDRAFGGHLLAFEVLTGRGEVMQLDEFVMDLPLTADFAAVGLDEDRQQELQRVEKDKK